ncbi:MAG: uroporphyrinogen-III C-methyltransferase [Eubacteriaceae bacterium]|nr:uroporphyrinogen-III C-methyltransferase [Eubacteriaceae bacterium]
MNKGYVYITGGGPGNPLDVTLRAVKALENCDAVLYDDLVSAGLLKYCRPGTEEIYVGKRTGRHSMKQPEICELLCEKALEGKTVVRLKGGDPFVFGRGPEECEALSKAGIPYELIPGVTSATSVPMAAGIPVTLREESRSFSVITGHTASGDVTELEDFKAYAAINGTLVFLMGLSSLKPIADALMHFGKDANTPAAVISNGTKPEQHVVRAALKDIARAAEQDELCVTPAIIVVGEAAGIDLRSPEDRPLSGCSALVCASGDFCAKLSGMIEKLGGSCAVSPILTFKDTDPAPLEAAIENIGDYSAIVFTGSNGARRFFDRYFAMGKDIRGLSHLKTAVIGEATGDFLMETYHIAADIMPGQYTSDALGKALTEKLSRNERMLIPRAVKGTEVLSGILKEAGMAFDEIAVYDSEPNPVDLTLLKGKKELIFASSEGVRSFFAGDRQQIEDALKDIDIICIGKFTAETLAGYIGRERIHTARKATAEGIVEYLTQKYNVEEQ